MFNILPQIDISSVCSWEKIIALCVYTETKKFYKESLKNENTTE